MTIRDVAAAAGVSHQTVANVLRTPDRVAPATRAKVEHQIRTLGFRPNRMAQNLSKRQSRLIGFRVQAGSSLTTGGILDSLLHALAVGAEEIDHHIVLFHSPPGAGEVDKARIMHRESIADAFIVAETYEGDARPAGFVEAGLPFVSFGRTDCPQPHHWVDTDNIIGTRLAVAHLVDLGHRQIGFAGWPESSWAGDDRHEGWRAELSDRGLAHGPELVARTINHRQEARAAVEELLVRHPGMTGIVAVSDEMALGVLEAATALQRSISVVGYDDSPMALVGSGLTTIRQPITEIARRILDIAAELIAGRAMDPVHERIAPQLVVRGSTHAPA